MCVTRFLVICFLLAILLLAFSRPANIENVFLLTSETDNLSPGDLLLTSASVDFHVWLLTRVLVLTRASAVLNHLSTCRRGKGASIVEKRIC